MSKTFDCWCLFNKRTRSTTLHFAKLALAFALRIRTRLQSEFPIVGQISAKKPRAKQSDSTESSMRFL
jgi:hypothetical protein